MRRSSGILLHLSSLPSKYGTGGISKEAYGFVDFLKKAGQRFWQVLPLGMVEERNGFSPYSSPSSFAGNELFIDLEELYERGMLTKKELASAESDCESSDYEAASASCDRLLRRAFESAERYVDESDFAAFADKNKSWLSDYALFMALKSEFGGAPLEDFPDDARRREPECLERYEKKLRREVEYRCFAQYVFHSQFKRLKKYAAQNGVEIIGDLPIYPPLDSADVWSNPQLFMLGEDGRPSFVAGVPPDYFSPTGQLWGSPVYDWEKNKETGYDWWLRRLEVLKERCDAVRFDHFRGVESFWCVPAGSGSAADGHWEKGPGMDFVNAIKRGQPELFIIAEDLGFITDEVKALVRDSGFYSIKVLQFSLDPWDDPLSHPDRYGENVAAYSGTHDNTTAADFLLSASDEQFEFAQRLFGLADREDVNAFVLGGMRTSANLFIAPMQDFLGLGANARMNTPSVPLGNWRWRVKKEELTDTLASKIRGMTRISERE